jgi:uncharacterized membrane-anchored protein YitT (DUF2179 family)
MRMTDQLTGKGCSGQWQVYFRKYVLLFLGSVIAAAGLEFFLVPNHIIDGGVVGIAIMLSAVTGYSFGLFLIVVNLPFLYLGYRLVGWRFTVATTFAIGGLAFWTAYFGPIPAVTDDLFLAAIFGGIIDGIGVGMIIRSGGSLDGTEIVAIILDKRSSFSVGEVVMFFNLFILGSAGFVFGWDRAMYSLVAYFVIAKMIDVVLKGLDESYAVMTVTTRHDEVAAALTEMGRGVTLLHGEGGYTGEQRKILYCVVTRLELDKVKNIVQTVDEQAFMTINPVHDIIGGRFNR